MHTTLTIQYAPTFVRMYKHCPPLLKEEIKEKIALFQNTTHHQTLHVHKLKGVMRNTYAFSVNYRIRIVFEYENTITANLLYVGDHDAVYE